MLSSWARLCKFFQLDCSLVCPESQDGMKLLRACLGKHNLSRSLPELEEIPKENKTNILGTG